MSNQQTIKPHGIKKTHLKKTALLMVIIFAGVLFTWWTAMRADSEIRADLLVLTLLLGFVYVLFRRTNASLRAQQAKLRANEEYLSATLRSIGDGVITCDTEGNIINLNTAAEKLTGWRTDEAKGQPIVEVFHTIHNETRQEAENLVGHVLREDRVIDMASHTALIARDGIEFQISDSCAPIHDAAGGIIGAVLVFRDISEEYHRREQMKRRQDLSYDLLGILNSSADLPDMINAVVLLIKRWIGFDAVGIRLQAGDDFPYFAQNGFSDDFLLTENTLLEYDKDGGFCRDKDGNVSLQCTCGLVISGKTDPANSLFTPGGSFWTNNSFSLLELPSDKDPRLHPRNRCMHEGYGSLAMIPIFENQKIVGLLQLNNRKTDSLSLDTISFFELISANIGEALMRKKAEWALKERFKELNCLYGISALIELPEISLKEILQKTVMLIPPAWQFSEITAARITIEGQIFQTEHFRETPWMQTQKIMVNGKPAGQVEVCYLEERPAAGEGPFLIEERQLIRAVAERLGRVIERNRAEEQIRESEERTRTITDYAHDAITMMDNNGNISYWNPAAEQIFGYTSEEAIGRNLHELLTPERFLPAHLAAFPHFKQTGQGNAIGKTLELAARRKDGREIDIALSLSAVKIKGAWNAVGIIQDITERKKAEEALRKSEDRFKQLAEVFPETIFEANMKGDVTYANEHGLNHFGYTKEDIAKGLNLFNMISANDRNLVLERILNRIQGTGKGYLEYQAMKKDGSTFYAMALSVPFIVDGTPVGIRGFILDISERKKAEEQIKYMATHDLLTDLPSLRLAKDRLFIALNMARRYKKTAAVMFVDLDDFKDVNDTLGHDAGDYVLRQVAKRLLACVRETDTVARIGGDEFLIIATEIKAPENAAQIAEKVIQMVSKPFIFEGHTTSVGASIGIALFPDHGKDMDHLIKKADEAMYKAKNAGRNGFRFVDTAIK